MIDFDTIRAADPELCQFMESEMVRQREHLELIASENFTSMAIMAAMGSHLTNKYAEGYPGKRYYGGCEFVDKVETLAIERACKLFGAEHANVQAHSGAQANMAVYFSLIEPGDTVLGMNLAHGGHLTHGLPVNMSGKYFNFIPYGVDEKDERIDYDQLEALAMEHKPKMIVAGASAYPRAIDFERIGKIAKAVNAWFFVDMAHIAGLVAAGLHQSPIPYADVVTSTTHKTLRGPRGGLILCKKMKGDFDVARAIDRGIFPGTQGGPLMHIIAAKAICFKEAAEPSFVDYQKQVMKNAVALADQLEKDGLRVVSGGTDNHLMLVDLTATGRTGKDVENLLGGANITVNKNAIPFDQRKPFITSGVRIGTPAVTTRGLREEQMRQVGTMIAKVAKEGEAAVASVKQEVLALCGQYPLYR